VRAGDQLRLRRDGIRHLGERRERDGDSRLGFERRERREQTGVLLVGRDDVVAAAELHAVQDHVHPVGRRVGQGDLAGWAAHQPRRAPAQVLADLHDALEVRLAGAAGVRLRRDRSGRRCGGTLWDGPVSTCI
jgi:hypothetical protein